MLEGGSTETDSAWIAEDRGHKALPGATTCVPDSSEIKLTNFPGVGSLETPLQCKFWGMMQNWLKAYYLKVP